MENVFFGENGLTSTSANFIANQAKEYVESLKEYLSTTNFLDSTIELIGSGKETLSRKGFSSDEVKGIEEVLNAIVSAYSLIAWLREALKAKEDIGKQLREMDMYDWAKENNITLPEYPGNVEKLSESKVIATWSVKDRNRYLTAQTFCSVYGKYIHPDGDFSKARKEFLNKRFNSIEYTECGSNTIIHRYTPTVDQSTIESTFKNLQFKWRENQAIVNSYKHKIDTEIQDDYVKRLAEYRNEYDRVSEELISIRAKYQGYIENKQKEASALKIIIPNDLKAIYNLVKEK